MDVNAVMGRVGLPGPIASLADRRWEIVVVGGGHNGLAAAAYLARAGRSVLVLERREQLGGACTLERPFEDERYVISPCAYVVGLLDRLVIDELGLRRHGYAVMPADPNLWCPLPGGGSFASFLDRDHTEAHLLGQGFADDQIAGYFAYEDAFERARLALRHGERDSWVGAAPARSEIEELLGGDEELISLVFEDSIEMVLRRHLTDERLVHALFGQGLIGTFAGPREPGTAQIKLMHHQGDLDGLGSVWGYVEGGIGRVSFAIAQAAIEAGATIASGVPVARILPGEGVVLESGERIEADAVVCNADPKRALAMLDGAEVPADYREQLEAWEIASPVLKVNAALSRLPRFADDAAGIEPHRAMITVTPGLDAAQEAVEAARRGEPRIGFAEIYCQSAYDPSVAPPGGHTLSVFAQFAPHELASGTWDERRAEIGELVWDLVEQAAPDVRDCLVETQILGPPDIEERIGLTGGHIFQGECLPHQMWERRLAPKTPIDGLYLCGAATHPGGSVIGLNGRNAAMAVLAATNVPG